MMEVHRWRGAPELRAMRAEVRKLGQFAYFDQQLNHPNWSRSKVLDFGGTDGNLLWNPDCAIRHENYYCLDVTRDAIEEGRRTFPRAHWTHYDRYNCSFNPSGDPNLPIPDLGTEFDVILAYSVFTHTTREEMHDLVNQLRARLTPDGVLAFTFEDPRVTLAARMEVYSTPDAAANLQRGLEAEWCALVDGHSLYVDNDGEWSDDADSCMTYDTYYSPERMQREFPDAVIHAPVNGEVQHCCDMRRQG
jgi:2-polyprenyl-3-methyl-5-hydroxy-6-metoxy-1,4-benzoquinol methylase